MAMSNDERHAWQQGASCEAIQGALRLWCGAMSPRMVRPFCQAAAGAAEGCRWGWGYTCCSDMADGLIDELS